MLGYPADEMFKHMVISKLLNNSLINVKDVTIAYTILSLI